MVHSVKSSLGALVLAVSFVPLATSAATPRPGALERALVARPACGPSQLAVWINTQGSGAAGSFYYDLEFTNISMRACTLTGYPGVSGLNAAAAQLGAPAARDPAHAAATVTLKGALVQPGGPVGLGGSATAVLRIVDVDNFPAATCGRATAAGLRVYSPGQTVAKFVSLPFLACARTKALYLFVQALQVGLASR